MGPFGRDDVMAGSSGAAKKVAVRVNCCLKLIWIAADKEISEKNGI
jgi:hypothetical protein